MKHYQTKQITKHEKTLTHFTCDVCEAMIHPDQTYYEMTVTNSTGRWYWYDSESNEGHFCSSRCLQEKIDADELRSLFSEPHFEILNICKRNKDVEDIR